MKGERSFRNLLLEWNRQDNKREMPWKGEKDPYKVWLSEVILQQTRVEQGWSYYERFVSAYPTVEKLASARDEDVFKLWEGLGYYTRCRNLLHTARAIAKEFDGQFPADYESIVGLKGIGSYTASAIASFCFDLPHAVVDGNVLRVIARFFGIDNPVDTTEGKKFFGSIAQSCLDKKNPGEYNQAIMDFGATVCKPAPLCDICPLQKNCMAFKLKKVLSLPVKSNRLQKKDRWFSYFVFSIGEKKFLRRRTDKDIWQHLYEFYLLETSGNPQWTSKKIKTWLAKQLQIHSTESIRIIPAKSQTLTHRIINGYFIEVELSHIPRALTKQGAWLHNNAMNEKPFPRFIHQYFSAKKPAAQLFPL